MTSPDSADEPFTGEGASTASRGTSFAVQWSLTRPVITTIAVFLAGPIIWSVHFMVVYLVAEAGCTGDGPGLSLFDPPLPVVVTLAATVIGAAACLLSALWGYRRWRARRDDHNASSATLTGQDTGGLLSFGGFVMSLLGFATVLFVGVPAAVLGPC